MKDCIGETTCERCMPHPIKPQFEWDGVAWKPICRYHQIYVTGYIETIHCQYPLVDIENYSDDEASQYSFHNWQMYLRYLFTKGHHKLLSKDLIEAFIEAFDMMEDEDEEEDCFVEMSFRNISKDEAKKEIIEYFKKSEGKVYLGDIIMNLLIDPELIMNIMEELEEEKIIGDKIENKEKKPRYERKPVRKFKRYRKKYKRIFTVDDMPNPGYSREIFRSFNPNIVVVLNSKGEISITIYDDKQIKKSQIIFKLKKKKVQRGETIGKEKKQKNSTTE